MNPARLNHRIKFSEVNSTQNEYMGVSATIDDILETWGSLEPVKQYNQWAIEAGANVLNGDKILIIRYRNAFQPTKDMLFTDLQNNDVFTVHAILPYYEKEGKQKVYKDKEFITIIGKNRE